MPCTYVDYFVFEYTGRDDKLRDWLYLTLPVAKILGEFRGDPDLIVVNGDSRSPSKVIHKALDNYGTKYRLTSIAGTIIIRMIGGVHSVVTALGEKMCSAVQKDLVHRSNEKIQLEYGDIDNCIVIKGKIDTQLSANVDQFLDVAQDTFGYVLPRKVTEKPRKTRTNFIKAPDFSFHPRLAYLAKFKNRRAVGSVFGEISSSESAQGVFDALLFVAGTNLRTDLSVNVDLKVGKYKGEICLTSLKVTIFDITAGGLLELSRKTDIDDKDRCVLRAVAKLKAREGLDFMRLLKRLIDLSEITPVTIEKVRSELFGDSGRQPDLFSGTTIRLIKSCTRTYGKLPHTVDRTIAHYEEICNQVSNAKSLQVDDEMEERILRLVASHPSAVTVTMTEDFNFHVDPADGISFPAVSFSGLVPHGDNTSVLSAHDLSMLFMDVALDMGSSLHEKVPIYQLDGIEDIDKESLEACARAMFPKNEDAVNELTSLFDNSKRKDFQVQLQFLTRDALMRIGGNQYEIPSNASQSLALAYAIQSVRNRKQETDESDYSAGSADIGRKRKRSPDSNSEADESTGLVEDPAEPVGSTGTSTERLDQQIPSNICEVLENMPISTRHKSQRIRELLLESPDRMHAIDQDAEALRGLERLLQGSIDVIECIFSVPEVVHQYLHQKGTQSL